jgi:hypothetical protein
MWQIPEIDAQIGRLLVKHKLDKEWLEVSGGLEEKGMIMTWVIWETARSLCSDDDHMS